MLRRPVATAGIAGMVLLSACTVASSPSAEGSLLPVSATPGRQLTYVAFGDSWPYGAHCNGCRPFPELVADGLPALTDATITFDNAVTNGGTAQELAARMETDATIRDEIGAADLIVIATGGNDLGPAFEAYSAGTCGGADGLDCFRAVRDQLRTAYDTMLTEIDELRAGQRTAVRMVTTSNEFLADPALIELFGPDFGATGGVAITMMNRDAQCETAEAHGAVCVDLGLALNGPDLTTPQDVNTQDAMQRVADAILAVGLPELED